MIQDLLQDLYTGDQTVIPEIVIHYLLLVKLVSGQYILKYPQKREDIIASGMFGLVWGVHRLTKEYDETQVSAYLKKTIKRWIQEYLDNDYVIYIPRSTLRLKGEEILPKLLRLVIDETDEIWELRAPRQETAFDYEILFQVLRLSNLERKILEARIIGYTLQEIGDSIQRPHVYVKRVLTDIGRRWIKATRFKINN